MGQKVTVRNISRLLYSLPDGTFDKKVKKNYMLNKVLAVIYHHLTKNRNRKFPCKVNKLTVI